MLINKNNLKLLDVLRLVFVFWLVAIMASCASVAKLPAKAADVRFVEHIAGVPSAREYDQCVFYQGISTDSVLKAARFAFVKNGFDVRKASVADGMVSAEHGMTARDWNIVAGIYFLETPGKGVAVKFIIRTAVSTSLYKEDVVTARDWTNRLLEAFDAQLQRDTGGVSVAKCG